MRDFGDNEAGEAGHDKVGSRGERQMTIVSAKSLRHFENEMPPEVDEEERK
jgi:hypothetical protein